MSRHDLESLLSSLSSVSLSQDPVQMSSPSKVAGRSGGKSSTVVQEYWGCRNCGRSWSGPGQRTHGSCLGTAAKTMSQYSKSGHEDRILDMLIAGSRIVASYH